MTLEVYSRYFNTGLNKTIVAVQEADQAVFVRFDAQLDGNQIDLPDNELLDRAVMWFINRYINAYATQKLDAKVREVEGVITKANAKLGELRSEASLNTASRSAILKLLILLYEKEVLSDEELASTGLFDEELPEEA